VTENEDLFTDFNSTNVAYALNTTSLCYNCYNTIEKGKCSKEAGIPHVFTWHTLYITLLAYLVETIQSDVVCKRHFFPDCCLT